MDLPLHRRPFSLNSRSFYLLIATLVISTLIVSSFWLGVALWQVGSIILFAWIPLVGYVMSIFYRLYGTGIALLFLLVVGQAAHLVEHCAQMVQIHLLGLKGPQASGIIGQLNNEWVHLIWNSWVLVFCFVLFYWLRKNPWLYVLFVFGIWHEAEHLYIISKYLQTGIAGNPGLIAKGGLIGGGLPIARPDLHFFYAVFEEALIILAFVLEIRRAQGKQAGPGPVPAVASAG
jgi:hypothetical protein